jgi:hypothetical protein
MGNEALAFYTGFGNFWFAIRGFKAMMCLVPRSKVLSLIQVHFRTMHYSGTFNCAGGFTQSLTCPL